MKLPILSKQEICQRFGCTIESLNNQYLSNAKQLEEMYNKAVLTGKKVNNYTAAQLEELTAKFYQLAQN